MHENAPCPRCQHANPAENRFCGRCGASLTSGSEHGDLVPRRRGSSVTTAAWLALSANLRPVGKALAVGAAALLAEACLSRPGRRAIGSRPWAPGAARHGEAATTERLIVRGLEETLVLLDEGASSGRALGWRVVRWSYTAGTTDRRS